MGLGFLIGLLPVETELGGINRSIRAVTSFAIIFFASGILGEQFARNQLDPKDGVFKSAPQTNMRSGILRAITFFSVIACLMAIHVLWNFPNRIGQEDAEVILENPPQAEVVIDGHPECRDGCTMGVVLVNDRFVYLRSDSGLQAYPLSDVKRLDYSE